MQNWLIESFHKRVFEEWLKSALSTQAVPLPLAKFDKFNAPIFRGRRWQDIDPSNDIDAKIRMLNAGLTSHSRILAELNIDRDELLDEIKDDKEAMNSRGIEPIELMSKAQQALPNQNQLTDAVPATASNP
jgi:capsid protein